MPSTALLGGGAWAFVSVMLFNIWRGSSFIGVLLLAGINAIPPELFEYARLDEKSAWRRFWLGDGAAPQAIPGARRCSCR